MFDPYGILQERLARLNEFRYAAIKESFAESFLAQCKLADNGCLIYLGGKTVRIPDHLADVKFTTPRRAAYLICNEMLPSHDLKLICKTPQCVLPRHLTVGRQRRQRTPLTRSLVQSVLSEPGRSIRYLARKYGLDRKMIKRIIEFNDFDGYSDFEE